MEQYIAEKSAVVVDIGQRLVKAGFAAEIAPRAIFLTDPALALLFDRSRPPRPSQGEWENALMALFSRLYFSKLRTKPRERRVLISTRLYPPEPMVRATLVVLLEYFQVPSVLFSSTSASALYVTGATSGIVVDVGLAETRILALHHGCELSKSFLSCPLGYVDVLKASSFEDEHQLEQHGNERDIQTALFPSDFDHVTPETSISCALLASIEKCEASERPVVLQNVLLCGSLGFGKRMNHALATLLRQQLIGLATVSLNRPLLRKQLEKFLFIPKVCIPLNIVGWSGCSIAASLASFPAESLTSLEKYISPQDLRRNPLKRYKFIIEDDHEDDEEKFVVKAFHDPPDVWKLTQAG